jgi:tetratricopeptide (TPR) repeat protein
VAIYRRLVDRDPVAFTPDLARAIANLGTVLGDVRQAAEALALAEEALTLYRTLAEIDPARFSPELAVALTNLGVRRNAVSGPGEAVGPTEEAVELYGRLGARNPAALRPALAAALRNLATYRLLAGSVDEAQPAAAESVEIYRELAIAEPRAFEPALAGALDTFATVLFECGRLRDGVRVVAEAADRYRSAIRTDPERYHADLVRVLGASVSNHVAAGDQGAALQAAREASALHRQQASFDPDAFRRDLGAAVEMFAWVTVLDDGTPSDHDHPLTAEAAPFYGESFAADIEQLRPLMADRLIEHAANARQAGQPQHALRLARAAVAEYRELVRTHRGGFLPRLADALLAITAFQVEAGGPSDAALAVAREAAELAGELVASDPETYRAFHYVALNNLVYCLRTTRHRREARATVRRVSEVAARLTVVQRRALAPLFKSPGHWVTPDATRR